MRMLFQMKLDRIFLKKNEKFSLFKILSSPSCVPIFIKCPSSNCNSFGQLQRIYIATPDSQMIQVFAHIGLKIQPNENQTCIFETNEQHIIPKDQIIVIRLPYVYLKDGKSFFQSPNGFSYLLENSIYYTTQLETKESKV